MMTGMVDLAQLLQRLEALEAENARLRHLLAERDARIAELEQQLDPPTKPVFPPKATPKPPGGPDRRRQPHRRHPGHQRVPPPLATVTLTHEVHLTTCPACGGSDLVATGEVSDHLVEDLPEPRVEVHRYRRHHYQCRGCQRLSHGRGDLELAGSHIGPRARLLACYARTELGLSLGKTTALLHEWFGLRESRPGALGHLRWGATVLAPVVQRLWEVMRQAPVIHADETRWRIDGQTAWAWCFANDPLALFLIKEHRNRAVLHEALGDSLPGVLVSDFYAVYDALDCRKQRCLVHLLRDRRGLRERLSAAVVAAFVQPVLTWVQDALALPAPRAALPVAAYTAAVAALEARFDHLLIGGPLPDQADCRRLWKRLVKHGGDLFTFLETPGVPADNNLAERDIRSLVAARQDGGTHRSTESAGWFATLKSITRTCKKQGLRFLEYGLNVVRAVFQGQVAPLPLQPELRPG
jgi:transposase